jgi:hypothetical protein
MLKILKQRNDPADFSIKSKGLVTIDLKLNKPILKFTQTRGAITPKNSLSNNKPFSKPRYTYNFNLFGYIQYPKC